MFFSLQKNEHIKLELYNLAGTKITTLINGRFKAGNHSKKWNAIDHAAGVYMVRLTTSVHTLTSKVILTR
ncbi:MAG: T9SS type A sorting domain-containing protein [Fibrobacteres bacterium]|nr:T9SS type A sorting domain-containing protein [Fibrobacterota bacterium]